MTQSQLFQTFAALTAADRRALRSFVRSPFHNQREDVVRLYDFLDKNYQSRTEDFKKETVSKAVFPENTEGVLAKQLNYVFSHLDKLIRQYLTLAQLEQEPQQADLLLNRALLLRGADRRAEKTLTQARAQLNQQPLKNATTHLVDFQLLIAESDVRLRQNRAQDLRLQEAVDAFQLYAVAEILRQACALVTHETVTQRGYQVALLPSALAFAKNMVDSIETEKNETQNSQFTTNNSQPTTHNSQQKTVAIKAYYHAYLALTETETVAQSIHFQQLKEILRGSFSQFPEAEIRGLYLLAINFGIRKMNRGERPFEREVLTLYQMGLDNKLLFENNHLTAYTYKNVMMAALKVGENDWAAAFLTDYKIHLPDRDREMIYRYNRALFDFRQNNFTAAMQLLQGVNLRETLFNLDARRLLARIYFTLNERLALDSLIESSKIYLHRQRGIGYHHDMYLNFFRILETILKADLKNEKDRILLMGQIESAERIAEREWLLGLVIGDW